MSNSYDDFQVDDPQVQDNPLRAIFDELGINFTGSYGDWPFIGEFIITNFQDRIETLKKLRHQYREISERVKAQLIELGRAGRLTGEDNGDFRSKTVNQEYIKFMRDYNFAKSFLSLLYNMGCYFATVASAKNNDSQIQLLLGLGEDGFIPATTTLGRENIQTVGIQNVVLIRDFVFSQFGIRLE